MAAPNGAAPGALKQERNELPAESAETFEYYEEQRLRISSLPPPSEIAAFKEILPSAPEIIFEQFRKEPEHRRDLERSAIANQHNLEMRSQIFAFVFAMGMIGACVYALHLGQQWFATIVGVGALATVVGAFLTNGESMLRRRGRSDKDNSVD